MFFKIGVLKNFIIFTGKHLCRSLFNKDTGLKACNIIKERLQRKCFPVNIGKFQRTFILKIIWERMLLEVRSSQNGKYGIFQLSYYFKSDIFYSFYFFYLLIKTVEQQTAYFLLFLIPNSNSYQSPPQIVKIMKKVPQLWIVTSFRTYVCWFLVDCNVIDCRNIQKWNFLDPLPPLHHFVTILSYPLHTLLSLPPPPTPCQLQPFFRKAKL